MHGNVLSWVDCCVTIPAQGNLGDYLERRKAPVSNGRGFQLGESVCRNCEGSVGDVRSSAGRGDQMVASGLAHPTVTGGAGDGVELPRPADWSLLSEHV